MHLMCLSVVLHFIAQRFTWVPILALLVAQCFSKMLKVSLKVSDSNDSFYKLCLVLFDIHRVLNSSTTITAFKLHGLATNGRADFVRFS